jgi:hypothetical protein
VLTSGNASLDDRRAKVLQVESRLDEESLDFIDRAGWNPWLYLKSLLIPAGLLARRGQKVEASLSTEVTETLVGRFRAAVSEGADVLLRANATRSFYMATPIHLNVEDGVASLKATVILRPEVQSRMDSYVARCGERVVTGSFDSDAAQIIGDPLWGTFIAYPLEVLVPLGAGPEGDTSPLVLELVSGGREPEVRTYTLQLPVSS